MGGLRTSRLRGIAVRCLVLGALAIFPAQAAAKTTNVDCSGDGDTGTGTALQTALQTASAGDTLVITGTCSEVERASDGETVFVVNKNLTIEAAPGTDAILQPSDNSGGSGARQGRVMEVTGNANVTLENLYFHYANASGSDQSAGTENVAADGGGLYVTSGSTATVKDDMFTADQAAAGSGSCNTAGDYGYGGGIYNAGTVHVSNTLFQGDSTNGGCGQAGGALFNAQNATATVTQSNITGNEAGACAGAGGNVYNAGTLTLTDSNVTFGCAIVGGGIDNIAGGQLTVANTTFSGNEAQSSNNCGTPLKGYGGAINNDGTLTLDSSTLDGNTTGTSLSCNDPDPGAYGAGLYNQGTATVEGTIIAQDTQDQNDTPGVEVDPDCDNAGTLTSEGYNLIGDGTGCASAFTQTTDHVGSSGSPLNPMLGALGGGFNGQLDSYASSNGVGGPPVGPALDSIWQEQFTNASARFTTFAMVPQAGSPVLDQIPAATCQTLLGASPRDQRGVARPQGSECDIGAVELQAGGPTVASDSYNVPENGTIVIDAAHGVLANDSTPTDGQLLVWSAYDTSGNTTYTNQSVPVQLMSDGSFSYTPPQGFTGQDAFSYRAIDASTDRLSQPVTVTLNVAPGPATTTTALAAAPNPSHVGGTVTYTAAVSPTPDGGTAGFTDGGHAISGCTAVAVSTSTGKAVCHVAYRATGSHTIRAVYGGDTNFAASQSSGVSEVIDKAATSTLLASSAKPAKKGKPVTYTATVRPSPGGGTVRFTDAGHTISGCGSVRVSTSTGKATCKVTYHSVGTHHIQASYSGDGAFNASKSSVLTQKVVD
jgi:hypothetical protein